MRLLQYENQRKSQYLDKIIKEGKDNKIYRKYMNKRVSLPLSIKLKSLENISGYPNINCNFKKRVSPRTLNNIF